MAPVGAMVASVGAMRWIYVRVDRTAIAAVVLLAATTTAQAPSGVITGIVRDTAGGGLAGAFVEVTSPVLTEKYRSTRAGSEGRYRFADLPDGAYSVTLSARGFGTQRRDNVVLTNGSTASVDTTMQVGGSECEELDREACRR